MTLGARLENTQYEAESLTKNRLTVVVLTTFGAWFLVNLCCYLIITQGLGVKGFEDLPDEHSNDTSLGGALTDTAPTSKLNHYQFAIYMGFFLWFTILFAGLGLELLTWVTLLQGGWSDDR